MAVPSQLCPTYRSGDDLTIEAGPVSFSFSAADFASRVVAAAGTLGFADPDDLTPEDVDDLVALSARGRIDRDGSALAAHVDAFHEQLLVRERDLVQWLRRLVVRDAWIDHQVMAGRLEPVFGEGAGFRYRPAGRPSAPILAGEPVPDLSELAFPGSGR